MLDDIKLETPRFDKTACANAQPVQPLPLRKTPAWIQKLHTAGLALNGKTKALALVIIAGLATGSLGGTLLATQYSGVDNESQVVLSPTLEEPATSVSTDQIENAPATAVFRSPRRHRRARAVPQRPRQAYRVAVITIDE